MEKEKNDKVEPDKAPKEKKPLTEEQRIKRNKMIAIPCMCLVCALVLWFIFKPSASEGEKGSKGFNMEMPDAGEDRCGGGQAQGILQGGLLPTSKRRKAEQ